MKGLKKLVLVTAIAATPLVANAQLKALNDSTLSGVTGQAGVTVELQTEIGIGSVVYTDTDSGGQFRIDGIAVGGSGMGGIAATSAATISNCTSNCSLDDLALVIDVAADGTATIDLNNYDGAPVDFGVAFDSMSTAASGSTTAGGTVLLSNFRMQGNLFGLAIGVGPTSSAIASVEGYMSAVAGGGTNLAGGTNAAAGPDASVTMASAPSAANTLDIGVIFNVSNMQFDVPLMGVGVKSMYIGGAGSTAATILPVGVEMAISAGGSMETGGTATNAMHVDLAVAPMDINMGEVDMGGVSIGSVAINGLTLQNTKMVIYGH